MRQKPKNNKRIIFSVIGTIIIGSFIWAVLMYNGFYGEKSSEQVSAGAISYEYLESLTLEEELELLEELEENDANTEMILLAWMSREDAIGYYANLKLARIYKLRGTDPNQYFKKALELYDTKEVKYEYAEYLERGQNIEPAIEIYKQLLPDELAVEALLKLGVTPEAVAETLSEQKHWQAIVRFYGELLKVEENDLSINMKKYYAFALGNLGQYAVAFPIFEELKGVFLEDHNLKWWYGRSLEEMGRSSEAMDVYKGIGNLGYYRLGLILEKKGKLQDAAEAYSKSNQNMSRWRGAQIWDEMGNKENALKAYLQIAKEEGTYQDDAAYRAYVLLEKNTQVAEELLKILEKHPIWMGRLGKDSLWDEVPQLEYERIEFLERVEKFTELNRSDFAKIELAIGEKNTNALQKLAIGNWYKEQKDFPTALIWGTRSLREEPNRGAYELAYPLVFEDLIRKWAEEFNVDPYLVWAIMREESHFRVAAISRVGALGLMQIMPSTGQDIAGRLKVTVQNKDLLIPETNIRFGTFYIRSMLNMFSGDVDKALAAYNGGGGNVKRWSNSNIGRDIEGFPTAITFLETREYITKVGNSYHIYKWLYEN